MRAVIYARYSSEMQKDASIEDQVRLCKERIAREGWSLASVYADRATSGSSSLRPGYQKLLEDARSGHFDVVVAEALDRLSRDQEDVAALFKRLTFSNVAIVTLAEGAISALHVGLKGTMNALFLTDLANKTRRGLRGRVEAGRSAGGLCYGYEVPPADNPDSGDPMGKRRIRALEAGVVQRIFTAFAAGQSPRTIALALNKERVPGPAGASWGPSTINGNAARGTGILNNELYIGRLVWNRLRYIKDPDTGKRVSMLNPPGAWITKDVQELRIVDDQLWQRVKERQKQMKRATRPDVDPERPFWDRRRPRYLFSGLMRCGSCGGGYSKISATLFGCANARNKGTCTNRLNIRRDALEAIVLEGLKHRLMDPDLFKAFAEEFLREVNRLRMQETGQLDAIRTELAAVERRLRKIVEAIGDGAPARALHDELGRLEARQDELKASLASAAEPKPLLHPNLAEIYRRQVAELHRALEDEATRLEASELIRSLVEAIMLVPEGGVLKVEIKGELAGILRLALNGRTPGAGAGRSLDDLAAQIKLVAGTGFEPVTFRL